MNTIEEERKKGVEFGAGIVNTMTDLISHLISEHNQIIKEKDLEIENLKSLKKQIDVDTVVKVITGVQQVHIDINNIFISEFKKKLAQKDEEIEKLKAQIEKLKSNKGE